MPHLSVVLKGIIKAPFEPLQDTSLRLLTFKTVFLVAITMARRIGEVQVLSVREPFLKIYDNRVVLQTDPGFTRKMASDFHKSKDMVLFVVLLFCSSPSNSKEQALNLLDVRRCLLKYLQITSEFRSSDARFVLYAGKQKGKQTSKKR